MCIAGEIIKLWIRLTRGIVRRCTNHDSRDGVYTSMVIEVAGSEILAQLNALALAGTLLSTWQILSFYHLYCTKLLIT